MPPQAALGGFFVTAPSVFTFSQFAIGGCHITSLIMGALGGRILIFEGFKNDEFCYVNS